MDFAYPLVVCDVGATNARFARIEAPHGAVSPLVLQSTGRATTFEAALDDLGWSFRSLLVSAAGPVSGARARLTNAPWTIDGQALARRFALHRCLVLNDFEAQAIALPHLGPNGTRMLIEGAFDPARTALVLGPGTGFGVAALVAEGGRWRPLPSEAGHMRFGPATRAEEAVWRALPAEPVVVETLLSGPGLARLHGALAQAEGRAPDLRAAPAIVAAALAGDASAAATLRLFWRLLARIAGDLALAFLARGGVTLAGGVLPRLVPFFDAADFASAFADKGARADIAGAVPVRVITDSRALLEGLAAFARAPHLYALDAARFVSSPRGAFPAAR